MFRTNATVRTANASKYLQQLCKHWGHKFETQFGPHEGTIEFGEYGRLDLLADDDFLSLALYNAEETSVATAQASVEDHIKRFAFREKLEFVWTAA